MSTDENFSTETTKGLENYFPAQKKSLEARIENIALSPDAESELSAKVGKKLIRDKVLGLFKLTEVAGLIINWNETVEKEIKQAKKERLLEVYLDSSDQQSEALSGIINFLSNPEGNILFNKVLRIQDDSPPDLELVYHLAATLKHITHSDFVRLFEAHRYALSLIEHLTPQEMSILTTAARWRPFSVNSMGMSGDRVTSPWISEFVSSTLTSDRHTDPQIFDRIRHSVANLERTGLVQVNVVDRRVLECKITQIGAILIPYLKRREE